MADREPLMAKGRWEIKSTHMIDRGERQFRLFYEGKFIGQMSSQDIALHLVRNGDSDHDMVIYNDKDIWPSVREYLGDDADIGEEAKGEESEVLMEKW